MSRTTLLPLLLVVLHDAHAAPLFEFHIPEGGFIDSALKRFPALAKNFPSVRNPAEQQPNVGQPQFADTVVKNVVSTILSTTSVVFPNDINMPKISVEIPNFGLMVFDQGRIEGLKNFTLDPLESVTDENGRTETTIRLHFNKLRVFYRNITVELWGIKFNLFGDVALRFKSNHLVTKIAVVKYYEMFENIVKNQCVCFLTSLNITDLGDVKMKFSISDTSGSSVSDSFTYSTFSRVQEAVTFQLNYAIVKKIYDILPSDGAWLCKGDRLHDYVLEAEEKNAAARLANQQLQESTGSMLRRFFW